MDTPSMECPEKTNIDLLHRAIQQLDFQTDQLFDLTKNGILESRIDWMDKGDWLQAARRAGAEKIFFVENNPVVVFARCPSSEEKKIETFHRLWCLARPRILFLEAEGELSVIDLAQPPPVIDSSDSSLETLLTIREVTRQLQEFHRDRIESGKVFENGRFGNLKDRADQALIRDLKEIRKELINCGLLPSYAHALIGRSIFIRYLEDRGILTEDYFKKVAEGNPLWEKLLSAPSHHTSLDFAGKTALYPRVLQNKAFTYSLFRSLSVDFNGDMFPDIDEEEKHVQDKHLTLIEDLLYGDVGIQKKLFFHSYQFDIIPLDLISSIYEEFYHSSPSSEEEKKTKARQDGAFYTPPVLAEFVASRLLPYDVLEELPRVLDPACGSGIFLVEAFRRMVRFEIFKNQKLPSFEELKQILGQRIAGIEVNPEAARITAFSLYLAMLHYLSPPSILNQIKSGNKLPNLVATEKQSQNHYNSLFIKNAFSLRPEDVGSVDVIIGNPPWGAPGRTASKETKERQEIMLDWCQKNRLPIGDKEPSQAFLWKALDFLKQGGRCSFLTSAGVLLKQSSTSRSFRKKWTSQVALKEVFNFTHVRKCFFKGAISPFVMINFSKEKQEHRPVEYWSPKQVLSIKENQAVLVSKYDRAFLVGQDLTDNRTWKVNWFGRHADVLFINSGFEGEVLERLVSNQSKALGRGYQTYNKSKATAGKIPDKTLVGIKDRYSPIIYSKTPEFVYNYGPVQAYLGRKIIFNEGISEKGLNKGRIIARFENDDFSFYRALYGLKLNKDEDNIYLLILGIIWSSFARYFFFHTTANWGVWNHKVLLDELLQLPIPSELNSLKSKTVIQVVKKLCEYSPEMQTILYTEGTPEAEIEEQRCTWETELDEAVFNLYGFSQKERDLIRDCCEVTLPFFYQPFTSVGTMPAYEKSDGLWLKSYAERFASFWRPYLKPDEELRADLHVGASGNMLAIEFFPADIGDAWDLTPKKNGWESVLQDIGDYLPHPMGTSEILLDGIVHVVTKDSIVVIKRNEKRFWTRSLAYEDAESTLAKRMFSTAFQQYSGDQP